MLQFQSASPHNTDPEQERTAMYIVTLIYSKHSGFLCQQNQELSSPKKKEKKRCYEDYTNTKWLIPLFIQDTIFKKQTSSLKCIQMLF